MLEKTESITITGRSVVGEKEVCGFQAVIRKSDPKNMQLSTWKSDKELYKENRVQCRADEAEFEDYAYAKQDELIAQMEE